jgi:hypothetical protein
VNAELNARRTAAAAVLADYLNGPGTADANELSLWAARLASMLGLVLDGLTPEVRAVDAKSPEGEQLLASLPAVTVSASQMSVLRDALAEAEAACRDRAAEWCGECADHQSGACQRHLDDLDQADEYRKTAAELGIATEGGQ